MVFRWHISPSDKFEQLLILMYKDIINCEKIPGLYILANKKNEFLYDIILDSIINIITQNNKRNINVKYIISDNEIALVNSINKKFINIKRISCYYHYKKNIIDNLKKYGLYKKNNKYTSDKIIKKLGMIPFKYKGNIRIFDDICNEIITEYPLYTNFINNYFINIKRIYFLNGAYDYYNIPNDCKSNSFLENYNKYLKEKLGRKRIINWFTFLNFLKEESSRSIEKLINEDNYNIDFNLKKTKFEDKYNDKLNKDEENENTNNNNINWLKWSNNCCRYDAFLTLYSFVIKNNIINIHDNCNEYIKFLDARTNELLNEPTNEKRLEIWKYF